MIGKFYGITAPLLILSGIPKKDFSEAVSYLNNEVDREILSILKLELDKLEEFLDNNLELSFKDRADIKLARRVKTAILYREGKVDIDNGMTDIEIEQAETLLKDRPRDLSDRIIVNGKVMQLGDIELKILEQLVAKKHFIDIYRNAIEIGSTEDIRAFNYRVSSLINLSPLSLKAKALQFFDKGDSEKVMNYKVDKVRDSYNILASLIVEPTDVTDDIKLLNRKLDQKVLLDLITEKKIPQEGFTIYKRAEKLGLSIPNVGVLKNLLQMYTKASAVYSNIKEAVGDCTDEQIESAFESLDSYGLIGFNVSYDSFFDEFLRTVTFAVEQKIDIVSGTDLYKFTKQVGKLLDALEEDYSYE